MGVLMFALFLAVWSGLAVAVGVGLLLRWRGVRSWAIPSVAGILACAVLFVPLGKWLWSTTIMRGENVSRAEFRAPGPPLPAGASNITYYSNYGGTEAVFSLTEDAFRQWAADNAWPAVTITAPERVWLTCLKIKTVVDKGIVVEERMHPEGAGVHAVFDANKGLCYYRYSSY